MRRRDFIKVIAGSAAAWPLAAQAQQSGRLAVIGVLRTNPKDIKETFAEPFRHYMRALGWEEGRNIDFKFLWADGQWIACPRLPVSSSAQRWTLL